MRIITLIAIIAFGIVSFGQNSLRVDQSNSKFFQFTYTPHYVDTSVFVLDGERYFSAKFSEAIYPDAFEEAGSAYTPFSILTLGVPSAQGSSIEIISATYKEFLGALQPTPSIRKTEDGLAYSYPKSENYFFKKEEILVVPFETGVIRGLNIQKFKLCPVHFDPLKNIIRVYTSIKVKITFPYNQIAGEMGADDPLLVQTVSNYEVAKNWNKGNSNMNVPLKLEPSAFASGNWYSFEAPTEGMYKITKSMLIGLGIDAGNVDPRTIKIYNNGGTMLPEPISSSRPKDLIENAIIIVGEEDGRFDDSDYIIFYGRGATFFEGNSNKRLERRKNFYSDKNWYFITSGGSIGKRMHIQSNTDKMGSIRTQTESMVFIDNDKINLYGSGRLFLGEELNQGVKKRTFPFVFKNVLEGSTASIRFQVVNESSDQVEFNISFSDSVQNNYTISGANHGAYEVGKLFAAVENRKIWNEQGSITFSTVTNKSNLKMYIDFIEVNFQRYLRPIKDQLVFHSPQNDSTYEFRIDGFSAENRSVKVFDVTDFEQVFQIEGPLPESPINSFYFKQEASPQRIKKFVATSIDELLLPTNFTKVGNQNIRGITDGAEMILITRSDFVSEAERYKYYRENESPDKRTVEIFTTNKIYNEFSGGNADVTAIRDFIGHAYSTWSTKPKFLLILGGATYDFKDIEGAGTNIVPVYQTHESLSEVSSYSTDDYFVAVDGYDLYIDIAVGRLPGRTKVEISTMIDKIISYENSSDKGNWKNTFTLVADDKIVPSGFDGAGEHLTQSETLANEIIPKQFSCNKLYLARYPAVQTSFGRRKPEVNQALVQAINSGTLVVNYVGHGSPSLLADEQIFVQSTTIPALTNSNYFFMSVLSCDFGFFDRVNLRSATEELLYTKNAGAISVLASSRPSYSSPNGELMNDFYSAIFNSETDSSGMRITTGEATSIGKSKKLSPSDSRRYFLFGDPALQLALPKYSAEFVSLNSLPLSADIQIKALSTVELTGVLKNSKGKNLSDFNGEGIISVYDSERSVILTEQYSAGQVIKEQGGLLFKGKISIIAGEFKISFPVPKDISYENKRGKVVLYYFNSILDGIGYTDRIIVGGTDTTVVNDGEGPQISIAFDALTNESAYLIRPNSILKVKLEDYTGLNTTGTGIGHNIQAVLNDKTTSPIDLTNHFSGELNSGGKSGVVNYTFNDLQGGEYKLEVSAFDIFNNRSKEITYFKVVSDESIAVEYVMNYPNPFSSATDFTFQHNNSGPIDVQIFIYSIAGRKLKKIEQKNILDRFVRIPWNGMDEDGNNLSNGTYLYKLVVNSVDGAESKSLISSFVIMK